MSFHVPESGRISPRPELASTSADGSNGCFDVASPEPGWRLFMLCSDGSEWEHVSVHAYRGRDTTTTKSRRTPTWREMCAVKDLCWDPEDVVMQLHPRRSEYVNQHPNVLHLWRPTGATIPTPPASLVGVP